MRSSPPKNAAAKMNIVMIATERLRLRNSRRSSSGCAPEAVEHERDDEEDTDDAGDEDLGVADAALLRDRETP